MKLKNSLGNYASRLLCVAGMCLLATGCGGRGGADVQIDGSSTVYPITASVAEMLREDPEQQKSPIRVAVGKSGTGGGMKKFGKGEIDVCDASRFMKESEAEVCKAAGIEYDNFMVAYDGIAVCVNPENDWCDGLTVEQLKALFTLDSEIKTWKDLNEEWPAEDIKLFGPGADSGTFDSFNEQVLGKDAKVRTGYTQSEEDNVLVNGVAQDKYALGYFGIGYYVENADSLKVLGIDDGQGVYIKPTDETIRDKTYTPLSRPLFIYVNLESFKQQKVSDFVKFYIDHAAEAAQHERYVPVTEEVAAENQAKFASLKSGTAPAEAATSEE